MKFPNTYLLISFYKTFQFSLYLTETVVVATTTKFIVAATAKRSTPFIFFGTYLRGCCSAAPKFQNLPHVC